MGFFDKLKEQASGLSQQLDSALDSTGQKSQVNALRKQRGEMVNQLGESLLNQFRQGEVNVEELRPQADQIFDNERQLIELEKQIEAQKQAAAQAKAQQAPPPQAQQAQAPPPPGAQAAPPPPPPGAQQSAPAPPAAPQEAGASSCPSCGSDVPADSAFCPDCGTKTGG
jgi:phage tail tape-measure protein